MKATEHQPLWERIRNFSINDPTAPYNFSQKLARENNWTPAFTSRAIEEYRRFIFLCCISPTGASPSEVVDEVWHLHLTYTENYWKRFCGEALGKEIHHHPSKGGNTEAEKHRRWYAETLQVYEDVFNEKPPSDIWPPAVAQTVVHASTELLNYNQPYLKNFYFLFLPFLYPLLFGKLHPYALNGPQFLVFYALLLAATSIVFVRVRKQKMKSIEEQTAAAQLTDANAFQLARYVYGRTKAIETAVVDLVSKGILIAEWDGKLAFYPAKISAEEERENPLAATLKATYGEGDLLKMKAIEACYQQDLTYHSGLQNLHQAINRKDYGRYIVLTVAALIGVARVLQGIRNYRPVAYLELMMAIGGFILIAMAVQLSAKNIVQKVFSERYNRSEIVIASQQSQLAQFIFLGLATLAGSYAFANLETTFRGHRHTAAGDAGSSGCGSSGCGSSCGGGGCGGCGGGD